MIRLAAAAALALAAFAAHGDPAALAKVASGLVRPVEIRHAGDGSGRLFVVEQRGTVRIVRAGQLVAAPFLDLSSLVATAGDERGLLGLAFHPLFRSNGRFFVNYTRAGDGATVVAAYRVNATDPDRADAASAAILLTIAQPFENHNGGSITFGPDGFLYVGLGDGGSGNDPGNRAQDPQSLLGKLLRIDVDGVAPYSIPAGNPFATGGGLPQIYALGLRNPWKFGFDRITGDLYIGDVGQDAIEEIDYVPAGTGAGANFGWRVMEGARCTGLPGGPACNAPALTLPVIEYPHTAGCSVTGGYVYRGVQLAALSGRYVYADFCNGTVWSVRRPASGPWVPEVVLATGFNVSTFGEDEAGELYIGDLSNGVLHRFVAAPSTTVDIVEYYLGARDHYFITSAAAEIAALDAGRFPGWVRTGASFKAAVDATAGANPVCRFYIGPEQGDSHFFSASPVECAATAAAFPSLILETPAAMHLALPDVATGRCAAGQPPVYRLWNRRPDSNHRYTTDRAVRDRMAAQGYVVEGYGPDPVAMCAAAP